MSAAPQQCQHCEAKVPEGRTLCHTCVRDLFCALRLLPELLEELEVTARRQDRLGGGLGSRGRERPLPYNDRAASLRDEALETLRGWVVELGGRRSADPVRTLALGVATIATHERAGELVADVLALAGDPAAPTERGSLERAVDRISRVYAGACPSITGRDREGRSVECGTDLWAEVGDEIVACPSCQMSIGVTANRMRALRSRDLLPASRVIEVLRAIDEAVSRAKLDRWVRTRRLRPVGYLANGEMVPRPTSPNDEPVLSVEAVRELRKAS